MLADLHARDARGRRHHVSSARLGEAAVGLEGVEAAATQLLGAAQHAEAELGERLRAHLVEEYGSGGAVRAGVEGDLGL